MKHTKLIMGMPVTVEIIDTKVKYHVFQEIFNYFEYIDNTFSTYKEDSEISKINQGRLDKSQYSRDMQTIFDLAERTRQETEGYFDIYHEGKIDPSGIVKGWAIYQAALILKQKGFSDYYVEAGGDIQVAGLNSHHHAWIIGIRNPFNREEVIKVVSLKGKGIATSGTYIRGAHIYNPQDRTDSLSDIVSFTVIGPNVYEADRFATAAFAMGKKGINFIENLYGFEGYMIDKRGIATMTSGFNTYVVMDIESSREKNINFVK